MTTTRPAQTPLPRFIYKIETAAVWRAALTAGRYTGSPDDLRDGFIHFSTAAQVPGTFEKYFAGKPDLILAQIETANLVDALKWEASRGGALFPHLYTPLDAAAVVWTRPLAISPDGTIRFPLEMT